MSRGWPTVEVRPTEDGRFEVGFVWENRGTVSRRHPRTLFSPMAVCTGDMDAEMVAEGLRMRVAWERGYLWPPKGDRPILTVTEREGMVTEFGSVPW